MFRYVILSVLVLSLAACFTADAQENASEQEKLTADIRALSDALGDAADDREAVDLLQDFLVEYPDTRYTAPVLNAVVYYLRDELGDHDGAIAAVKAHIPKIKDKEHLKGAQVVLAGAYNAPRFKADLRRQVEKLNEYGPPAYGDYETLIEAAFGAEDWDLALELCVPAGEKASPEGVKGDYPDAPEETVAERSEARTVYVDICRGWALANTGESDEAVSIFESAGERVDRDYFGLPSNELHVYWGKTLMMKGDEEEALEKLLPAALWAENEDAVEAVREMHAVLEPNGEDFEDYLHRKRLESARPMESFEASDYSGELHDSKDLMGKVTLVSFWFPT